MARLLVGVQHDLCGCDETLRWWKEPPAPDEAAPQGTRPLFWIIQHGDNPEHRYAMTARAFYTAESEPPYLLPEVLADPRVFAPVRNWLHDLHLFESGEEGHLYQVERGRASYG